MIVQQLIILVLFVGAAFYVGRRLWQSFFAKSDGACPKGCGGACSAIDVEALQRTIEKAQRPS